MNKFIEVQKVLAQIESGAENCVTEGMSVDLGELDAFHNRKDLYCISYESLSANMHSTNEAQATENTIEVLENFGQAFLEVQTFALYTANGKNYIAREDYMKLYPNE